ncbi:MAG: flagellar biosynthesis protein FlhB [Deltaproteobacteria bacterium]|nr:flagellar biosynthesis protein FlhB [Deltaproteobacteria bacterium]
MAGDDQEKTESATAKRRREAREEGQVARSVETVTVFVLGATLLGLWVGAGNLYAELGAVTRYCFAQAYGPPMTTDAAVTFSITVIGALIRALLPVFVACIVGGLVGNLAQVGFVVSWTALSPKFDRLNPFSGLGNLFQMSKIVELLKTFLKIVIIGWAAYAAVKGRWHEFPFLSDLPAGPLLGYTLDLSYRILKNCLLVYLFIALADYGFQRWQFEKKLRMTKEEIKEEFKETEGDPLIKSRIRSLQREMARRRMMAEVPKSDVVITNPTHFAVALRYDPAEMDAPRVVAKGADLIAQKIIALAEESGVPRYQDPPVARVLYREAAIGDPIPADLFQAVAEILAHVYRLGGRQPAAAAQARP